MSGKLSMTRGKGLYICHTQHFYKAQEQGTGKYLGELTALILPELLVNV